MLVLYSTTLCIIENSDQTLISDNDNHYLRKDFEMKEVSKIGSSTASRVDIKIE